MSGEEGSCIPCTVWVWRESGEFAGCLARHDGELSRAGLFLLRHVRTAEEAERLVGKGVVWSVARPEPAPQEEGEAAFTPVCRRSLMRVQAKEHGGYCYVFDEATGRWLFGSGCVSPLEGLLEFALR